MVMLQEEDEDSNIRKYFVKPFTSDDIVYEIEVNEDDKKMIWCECPDFKFHTNASKHKFLLGRSDTNLKVYEGNLNIELLFLLFIVVTRGSFLFE